MIAEELPRIVCKGLIDAERIATVIQRGVRFILGNLDAAITLPVLTMLIDDPSHKD